MSKPQNQTDPAKNPKTEALDEAVAALEAAIGPNAKPPSRYLISVRRALRAEEERRRRQRYEDSVSEAARWAADSQSVEPMEPRAGGEWLEPCNEILIEDWE
jgi:hypothetical protein